MESVFDLSNAAKSTTERFATIFTGTLYDCRDDGNCMPSIHTVIDENIGPWETVCRLYPDLLGPAHFAKYLAFKCQDVSERMFR